MSASARYFATFAGVERVIEIRTQANGGLEVRVDGVSHPVDVAAVGHSGLLNLLMDGQSFTYAARFENGSAVLSFHDREVRVGIEDERTRLARQAAGTGKGRNQGAEITSVMPGVVKELRVAPGDTVTEGQALLILEAMKMENEIRAPRDGVVAQVYVQPGQAVEKGARLASLAPPAEAGG